MPHQPAQTRRYLQVSRKAGEHQWEFLEITDRADGTEHTEIILAVPLNTQGTVRMDFLDVLGRVYQAGREDRALDIPPEESSVPEGLRKTMIRPGTEAYLGGLDEAIRMHPALQEPGAEEFFGAPDWGLQHAHQAPCGKRFSHLHDGGAEPHEHEHEAGCDRCPPEGPRAEYAGGSNAVLDRYPSQPVVTENHHLHFQPDQSLIFVHDHPDGGTPHAHPWPAS